MAAVRITVRALIVREGRVLVVRARGAPYSFFPGGGREDGEPLEAALERELHEELGVRPRLITYAGTVENFFEERGVKHCELDIVFWVEADVGDAPESKEAELSFRWLPLEDLAASDVRPWILRDRVCARSRAPFWLSNAPRG